ncbi:MAG: hypothetical protein WC861_02085 [Candidatus Micrarchaeia archaeon]
MRGKPKKFDKYEPFLEGLSSLQSVISELIDRKAESRALISRMPANWEEADVGDLRQILAINKRIAELQVLLYTHTLQSASALDAIEPGALGKKQPGMTQAFFLVRKKKQGDVEMFSQALRGLEDELNPETQAKSKSKATARSRNYDLIQKIFVDMAFSDRLVPKAGARANPRQGKGKRQA